MKEFIIGCLFVLVICFCLAIVEGLVVSLLWNWLAPIFWTNAPILGIWEAFGVLVLINIVFSNIVSIFKSSK